MNELRVLNLSTYTSPKIVENKTDNFVAYGDDNNYFQFLIDRYNGSATNNAIINGMSEMIFGKGLDATDSSRKPEAYAKMITLFHDDCVRRLASDLKLMGNCAMQVIYSKDRKSIARVEHIPVETLRAEKCNEKGEIEAYYMHPDWASYKKSDKPLRIEAFGFGNESIQIYYVKPYKAGFKYYSPVDYQGGLQYAELEEEISNYHLNNIMNGLAPSMLINFNNGTPDPEQRQLIENRIYQKFSGSSNSGKFIMSFNDDPATAATIEPIQLSDAHNQYQFLSDESMRKIMVAHRVVSPMLLGVKDSSGLGNNADELKTASILMDNTVIRPFQTLLINAFDDILSYNDISLNLYFKTLQPLEFTELDNVMDAETREEETGVKMSAQVNFSNLEEFGEDEDLTDWELIDERKVDYDLEDELDKQINDLNSKKQSLLSKIWNFATTGTDMATALFISRTDLIKNTILDGNVDTDKFIQFIKISQQIDIQNYLGTDLYNKISNDIIANTLSGNYLSLVEDYVQPMLIHYAMMQYLPFAAYQIKNGGISKHTSENAESVTKDEVDYLVQKERNFAEYYTRRFIDYMSFNTSLFPEYQTNNNEDVYPDKNDLFNGWVL
jgi:hypothetical protein